MKSLRIVLALALLLPALPARADDCGSNNANGIATSVKAWMALRLKLQSATGGFGFSQQSADEGGAGDYAAWTSKQRQGSQQSIAIEFTPCRMTKDQLKAVFDNYYNEVKHIGQTFGGVGQGNLIQFPTCSGPWGANAARNIVVDELGKIYTSESDTQAFVKQYRDNPALWDSVYKPKVTGFSLPNCAEWIGPSIVTLWYAAHAATIVNMQGMARFPDWDQSAQMTEIASIIRGKLYNEFRSMKFQVNQGKESCAPGQ